MLVKKQGKVCVTRHTHLTPFIESILPIFIFLELFHLRYRCSRRPYPNPREASIKTHFFILCLILLLTACQPMPTTRPSPLPTATLAPQPAATSTPVPPTSVPPTIEPEANAVQRLTMGQLRGGFYHSQDWGAYQLVDGIFYRTPPAASESAQLYASEFTQAVFGDLNADGFQDAAVILTTRNGGNGNNKELAIVLDQDGGPINAVTFDIGFMVGLENLRIEGDVVILDLRVSGPGDALCCPSQAETRSYQMQDGAFVRLP
jgi:hypothetical protein